MGLGRRRIELDFSTFRIATAIVGKSGSSDHPSVAMVSRPEGCYDPPIVTGNMERRLAAIVAADMVGYSRLMETDETGTLERQKRHQAELIDPKIAAHHGNIVKLTGDGLIAEFPSVVEAVRCAVEVQREMAAREADVAEEHRIRYRIAVNLGDIIFEDSDVYGNGVIIAARLEALADPGGVVVSGTAYDHLKGAVEVGYEDLGEQQVKNIADPVRVYRVTPNGAAAPGRSNLRLRLNGPISVAAVVCLMLVAVAVWEFLIRPEAADAIVFDEKAVLAMPTGPRLAVMPFEDNSPEGEGALIAKGLTEEIATVLSANRDLGVLSPSSTRRLTQGGMPIEQVGEELSVDYLIDGTVMRSGEDMRISARLFSLEQGTYIWSQTYDGAALPANVFDTISSVSTSVAAKVGAPWAGEMSKHMRGMASSKSGGDLSSVECLFSYENYQFLYEEMEKRYLECLEKVLNEDPENIDALVGLGHLHTRAYNSKENASTSHGHSFIDLSSAETKEAAMNYYLRAVELDPTHPRARWGMAFRYLLLDDRDSFIRESKNALALGLDEFNVGWCGYFIAYAGEWDLGIALIERSKSIDPTNASKLWYLPRARKHFLDGEYLLAEKFTIEARLDGAGSWISDSTLAYIHGSKGDEDLAKMAVERVMKVRPDMTIELLVKIYRYWLFQEEFVEKMVAGLRAAGMPTGGYDG